MSDNAVSWEPLTWKNHAPPILGMLVFATFIGLIAMVIDKD